MNRKTARSNERHTDHVWLEHVGGLSLLSTDAGQGSCHKIQSKIHGDLVDDAYFQGEAEERDATR